ncbi:MAG: PmeII family type II restriction endonuclease [Blastocatellia bacterium]
MNRQTLQRINHYVNENIDLFHDRRLEKIRELKLSEILKRKNPYLFKAKNVASASELVFSIIEATLYASEEGLFGKFFEGLAIYVAELTCGGQKSIATGIDLELTRDGIRYLVAIKSGQNWGNSSQHQSLRTNFKNAVKVIKQERRVTAVQPVLGICYGKFRTIDNGIYLKIGGQSFWHFISGDQYFYRDLIEPVGYNARKHNENFLEEKANAHNRLTREFSIDFCDTNGAIDWTNLVQFNSGNLAPD